MLRKSFWPALLPLILIYVYSAYACEPVREAGADIFISFEHYRESQLRCGVEPAALPYILRANPEAPLKGTIVLVHGLGGNPLHLKQIADRLQSDGYNVVAPILQGHGGNDKMLAKSTLDGWQKDVSFAGEIARRLASPYFIGGHSTGGVLAALEASSRPGQYTAIFAMDPALNLEGKLAVKAKYACLASYIATFETDRVVSMVAGTPHKTLEKHAQEIRDLVSKTVEEHCGKGFPIPPYNTTYTLAGLCALTNAVAKIKDVKPQTLPATLLLQSRDDGFYGPHVSRDKVIEYVNKVPEHEIVKTDAQVHELMPANCSRGYESYVSKISSWLGVYSRSVMVEGPGGRTSR